MNHADEIVESGFAALRSAQPSQTAGDLIALSQRRALRAKVWTYGACGAGCLFVAAMWGVLLQPTSAFAELSASARLSASQPVVHLHVDRQSVAANPTDPPWPEPSSLDIWRFQDHYVRKEGHWLSVFYRDGRSLSYDNRFATGFRSTYDAKNDRFWSFDGTIGIEMAEMHRNPPQVQDVDLNGARFMDYVWHDVDAMQNRTVGHVYVDPGSKLVRSATSDEVSASGDESHSITHVEYPSGIKTVTVLPPQFPKALRWRTKDELLKEFDSQIVKVDQQKTLGGVRVNLYGVVVYPNVPDGIGVDVITTGGAGPDYGSGHPAQVVGVDLLPVKRSAWFPQFADAKHVRLGGNQVIGGRQYVVDKSDDLLQKAPSRITVRVPVWRLGRSFVLKDGKQTHPHEFAGYATFTTGKVFCNTGQGDWNFYDHRNGS